MTKHALISVVLLAVLFAGAGVGQGPAPKRNPSDEGFTGKAIAVHFKEPRTIMLLEHPQIRTFGGQHSYLIGQAAKRTTKIWIPLGDVAKIEEFVDLDELAKTYRLEGAAGRKP